MFGDTEAIQGLLSTYSDSTKAEAICTVEISTKLTKVNQDELTKRRVGMHAKALPKEVNLPET